MLIFWCLCFFVEFIYSDSVSIGIDFSHLTNLKAVPDVYWQSCGFTPASDMLNPNGTENLWWIGRVGREGIHYVRIHYLLDFLKVKGINNTESLKYEWKELDKAIQMLRNNNRFPIFELMGNPSMYWTDFSNKTQLYTWKDLVTQVAQRYITKYGMDIVSQWLWESWNEPPSWTEGFTFNKTSWEHYYDACNHGLLAVNKDLKFGGPACHSTNSQYLYYALDHVTNGKDYFTGEKGNIRMDFISKHNKGNQDEKTLLQEDLNIANLIDTNYSSLVNRSMFINDEGDPKVGWAKYYVWRATPSYAAFVVQGINYHLENFNNILSETKANSIPFALLSNDNCFMGDGSFQQRTVNARFNNTKTKAFEFIPKPGLHVMSLLSLHGNERMNQSGIIINGSAKDDIEVLTFVNQSTELYEILVIIYSSNANQNDKNTQSIIDINVDISNLKDIKFYDSIIARWNLDFKYGNPYETWKGFNSPKLPTMTQIETMRKISNPKLTINTKGGMTDSCVLNAPGLVMTHFVYALGNGNNWNTPPPMVKNVAILLKNSSYSFSNNNSYYISWDTIHSHILSTFIINYSKEENGSYTTIETNSILDGFVWVTSISTGYIRVCAMDYWGLNGTLSDPVELPSL
eukprot:352954_1